MKLHLLSFVCIVLSSFTVPLSAAEKPTRFCYQHGPEIRMARSCAANVLQNAHRNGGEIFRDTYVTSLSDLCWNQVKLANTYSDMSAVMREFLASSKEPGIPYIMTGWHEVSDIFRKIYTDCLTKHGHINAYYERGRLYFDSGDTEACVNDLTSFIQAGGDSSGLAPEMHLLHGQVLNDIAEYDSAIPILSNLIQQNPDDKQAYYQRAIAYFEMGSFDEAIADFKKSGKLKELSKIRSNVSDLYADGLLQGIVEGFQESAEELLPSLWYTVRGIGTTLWSCAETPQSSLNNFLNACQDAFVSSVRYLQTMDAEALANECTDEFRSIMQSFDAMSDLEHGRQTGYILGKYGTDAISGALLVESTCILKRLKDANSACVLETMAKNSANAEKIIAQAANHQARRAAYFEDVKIHWGRQNKHVTTAHNYEPGKSIFKHPDAQGLISKFAGTGRPTRPASPGTPGYREKVNFGETIGYHVDKDTLRQTATSWGEIHYSQTGAHIVPILPL